MPRGFEVYSSQSTFIRPVSARLKVNYHVDRTMEGRRFATRIVQASQAEGPLLYMAVISFQRRTGAIANDDTYADPMPAIGDTGPLAVPSQPLRQLGFQSAQPPPPSTTADSQGEQVELDDQEEPFDWRPLPFKPCPDRSQMRAYGFVRSQPLSTDNSMPHLGALAFLSDQILLELVTFTHWDELADPIRNLVFSTTLTHQISFHEPGARADQWMLCESSTSWGASGRVLIHQQFWNLETGQLSITCSQEAKLMVGQAQL